MKISQKTIDLFWSKVNVIFKNDGTPNYDVCWNWNSSSLYVDGYGQFSIKYKKIRSHRFSYIIFNDFKDLKSKDQVLHKCDNRKCVNPHHLFLGNHIDNMKDMVKKNRQSYGEKQFNSLLIDNDIKQILIDIYNDKYINVNQISLIYNVDEHTIRDMLNGKSWKHITDQLQIPLYDIRSKIIKSNQNGVNNTNSVLNFDIIKRIINNVIDGKYSCISDISNEFNISYYTIDNLLSGKTYQSELMKLNINLYNLKSYFNKNNKTYILKGSQIGTSKLTDEIVKLIKYDLLNNISITNIALKYNCANTTISNIKHNKTWNHVKI